jgi:hypothetical protein
MHELGHATASSRRPTLSIVMPGPSFNSPAPAQPRSAINGVKAITLVVTAPATPPRRSSAPYKR